MKRAIALCGGGTKGAYELGAWKALKEMGIEYHIVTGTSIGIGIMEYHTNGRRYGRRIKSYHYNRRNV